MGIISLIFLSITVTIRGPVVENFINAESLLDKSTSTDIVRERPLNGIATNTTAIGNTNSDNTNLDLHEIIGDFNGDGFEDKAIGAPWEDVSTEENAGTVHVIYGSSEGLNATAPLSDQLLSQGSYGLQGFPEFGDFFGSALSSGDYNGDGYSDLTIGIGSESIDLGTASNHEFDVNIGSNLQIFSAGVVQVIYGSSTGLNANYPLSDQFFVQGFNGLDEFTEKNDFFGSSLSSGDYNGDDVDDLAIGVGGEDALNIENRGEVQIIYGSLNGLNPNNSLPDELLTPEFIITDIRKDDSFGSALSSGDYNGDGVDDLAIGVPREDRKLSNGTFIRNTGAVYVIFGTPNGLKVTPALYDEFWTQRNLGGIPEEDDSFGSPLSSGDFNGDGVHDLAIGVDGEGIGGVVQVIYGSSAGLSTTATLPPLLWTQNSSTVFSESQTDTLAGVSITSGDYNGDEVDDLGIGAYRREVGTVLFGGRVHVLYGTSSGLNASNNLINQVWTQDSENIQDFVEPGDIFGGSLSSGDYNGDGTEDLFVGAPWEDVPIQDFFTSIAGRWGGACNLRLFKWS